MPVPGRDGGRALLAAGPGGANVGVGAATALVIAGDPSALGAPGICGDAARLVGPLAGRLPALAGPMGGRLPPNPPALPAGGPVDTGLGGAVEADRPIGGGGGLLATWPSSLAFGLTQRLRSLS